MNKNLKKNPKENYRGAFESSGRQMPGPKPARLASAPRGDHRGLFVWALGGGGLGFRGLGGFRV